MLLLTFGAMWLLGVPATIMSLGGIGIALGMAVDADVVALEASHRRLETLAPARAAGDRRAKLLGAAAHSFAPAILTVAAHHGARVPAGVRVHRRDRPAAAPARVDEDAGRRAAALVTLTLAPALRDRLLRGRVDPGVREPADARTGARSTGRSSTLRSAARR